MNTEEIIHTIVQCIYNVRGVLKQGFLESVYQRALLVELADYGLAAESEKVVPVFYKGKAVGSFRPDIIVENQVVIEIKAVDSLNVSHELQLVNYLTATGIENGILVNFGESFKVMRKFKTYRKQ